jgi:lysophospholipase L1-like esterase
LTRRSLLAVVTGTVLALAGAVLGACARGGDNARSVDGDATRLPAGRGGRDAALRFPADRDAPLRYVALGDSTVEGVGATTPERTYVSRLHARLQEIYPRSDVDNLGVAGATSSDVVREQLPKAITHRPDLVTLSVGPNDITERIGVDVFARNVEAIFRTLRARRETVVVATLLPDLGVTPRFRARPEREAVARRSVEFNDALRRQAKPHGVVLVDLYGPSRDEIPRRPELVAGDGYHPSDAGYARWAELMWQVIAPLTTH